jgi:uncharacterized protein
MFVAIFNSASNTSELRAATKPAHDEYWSTRLGCLRFAGPMLSDDGSTRIGQILVLDVPDRQAAEAVIANDPFVKAGLFTGYFIHNFRLSVESGRQL